MSSVERSKTIAASPEATWAVLTDFGELARWVPMIQHSCLLSEQTDGVGTVRRVQIARQTLVERVVTWDAPNELAYSIEGLPPIVGTARNTWRLRDTAGGCAVTLTTEIDTGLNPVKLVIAKKVLERMTMASEFMLAGLADAATATAPTKGVT